MKFEQALQAMRIGNTVKCLHSGSLYKISKHPVYDRNIIFTYEEKEKKGIKYVSEFILIDTIMSDDWEIVE